jgi:hypothetical protein
MIWGVIHSSRNCGNLSDELQIEMEKDGRASRSKGLDG